MHEIVVVALSRQAECVGSSHRPASCICSPHPCPPRYPLLTNLCTRASLNGPRRKPHRALLIAMPQSKAIGIDGNADLLQRARQNNADFLGSGRLTLVHALLDKLPAFLNQHKIDVVVCRLLLQHLQPALMMKLLQVFIQRGMELDQVFFISRVLMLASICCCLNGYIVFLHNVSTGDPSGIVAHRAFVYYYRGQSNARHLVS